MVMIIRGVYDGVLPCMMYCYCLCSVVLPRGAMCVVVLFSDRTHLLLEAMTKKKMIVLHYLESIASF